MSQLETLLDVGNVIVEDRPGHALAVSVRVQTDFLVADTEPDVVRLVRIRRDIHELSVQRLRLSEVLDGIDDCPDN